MPTEDLVMVCSYDPGLVVLSVLISMLAAHATRDLSERVRDARGLLWLSWLVGGATASGIATWSMHYAGMLAFSLPVAVKYDWPTVVLSLLVGVIGSAAALVILSRSKLGWPKALAAGIFMGGVGIPGLHFTGMAAMRLQGTHHHSPAPRDPVGRAVGRDFLDRPIADLSLSGRYSQTPPTKLREHSASGNGQPRHALHRDGCCHVQVLG